MPLAGYKAQTRTIALAGDNSFVVKGLSLNHIAILIREHFDDLEALMTIFTSGGQDIENLDMRAVALSLISNAPGFVANVIALSAGEGDASDAEQLPGPVQLKALLDIGELTFSEVGGVKKSMEVIAGLLKNTNLKAQIPSLKTKTEN